MTTPITDELLAAAQSGDAAALTQVIRAHRHGVYRYGLQVCRTTEDAEDAVQEALWSATRAIRTFRGNASSIASWLFTIVRRECYRLLERYRFAPVSSETADAVDAPELRTPDEVLDERARAALLAEALAALEPLHREVVLLRDIQELSAPEAAARLQISSDALKSRLHRARVSLRDYVQARQSARS